MNVIFTATPISNCSRTYDVINALLIVFAFATTLMFYIRVCAVYSMHRGVVVIYGTMWLGVVGMLGTIPRTFTAAPIAGTEYCGELVQGHLLGPIWIVFNVNNILVYAAIAYRIFGMFVMDDNPSGSALSILFTFGTALPIVSQALLKGSQLYFV